MNEETIGLWLREMEHLHAHLLHKYYAVLCVSLFVLSPVVILLSVLQQFTASDYPFGIFELLVWKENFNSDSEQIH
jgi:hypothetical protein